MSQRYTLLSAEASHLALIWQQRAKQLKEHLFNGQFQINNFPYICNSNDLDLLNNTLCFINTQNTLLQTIQVMEDQINLTASQLVEQNTDMLIFMRPKQKETHSLPPSTPSHPSEEEARFSPLNHEQHPTVILQPTQPLPNWYPLPTTRS